MKKKYLFTILATFLISLSTYAQFNDDMESYVDGQPISINHWTDWGCGGGAGCSIMSSSIQAHSGNLSGYIPDDFSTDAVLDLGNKAIGEWGLSFWMYLPSEKEAHWNLQGTVPISGGEWIVGNLYFNKDNLSPGVALIDNSFQGPINFNFPHDQWFRVVMNWDITNGIDLATWQFNVNGVDVIPPNTPFKTSDGISPTSLGGIDFFSISSNNQLWLDSFVYENGYISVEPDTEDPVAVCQDITAQLNNNGSVTITGNDIDNGSTDNNGILNYTASPNNFDCSNIGENTVTLIVEDYAGNTDSCSAIVTVEDSINPTVIGQDILENLNGNSSITILASNVDNGSSDNCELDSFTLTPDTFNTTGTFDAILEGFDSSGNNNSDTVSITIIDDNEAPIAICENIIIQVDTDGLVSITAGDVDGGSTDDSGILSLTVEPNSFDCSNIGKNIVTLTVEDFVGNIDTCTAVVYIEDLIDPIVIGQDATGDLNGTGTVTIPISDVDNGSSDNCYFETLTLTPDTFTETGVFTAVLEGTDPYSNTNSVDVTITITDILGINEENFSTLKVFPNPVYDFLNIESNNNTQITRLELFDLSGKLILEENLSQLSEEISIDLKWLANNIYFISIIDNYGNNKVVKLIKE